MANTGRPVEGGDPVKREAQRNWYRSLSPSARRAYAAKRDPQAQRDADNRRYRRDALKRKALHTKVNQNADPQKLKARSQARTLPLAQSCARCGSRTNLQRHHPDHSKPYKVVTLCGRCNSQEAGVAVRKR